MRVLIFGNPDIEIDNKAIEVMKKIKEIDWQVIDLNQDIPIGENLVLMDTVEGIDIVTVITEKDLDKLKITERTTAHDYDLGFQLKYLQKIRRLKKVTIIGLPQIGEIDYDRIQSILRKLVAQDIQGS